MHGSDYAYHFGWPRDYELYGNNAPVADVPAHRPLSNAMVARLIAFVHRATPTRSLERRVSFVVVVSGKGGS